MENRLLTINIRKYLVTQPRTKRVKKAVKYIRNRIAHYTKVAEDDVRMTQELNSLILKQHAKSMAPVKLSLSIDKGVVSAAPFSAQKKEAPGAAAQTAPANAGEGKGADGKAAKQAAPQITAVKEKGAEEAGPDAQTAHAQPGAADQQQKKQQAKKKQQSGDKAAERGKLNEGRK